MVYKKVSPGQKKRKGFPAPLYNGLVDILNADKSRMNGVPTGTVSFDERIILVENTTEEDVTAFSILSIDGFLFDNDDGEGGETETSSDEENGIDGLEEILSNGLCFKGVLPQPGKQIAILLEDVGSGNVGKAVVSGPAVALVNVRSGEHKFATVIPEETGHLESNEFGPVRMLGVKKGSGIRAAAILFLSEDRSFRTGVLQETFTENATETGRARVKLHVADYENSSEENGLKTKLGEEEVTAYCSKAKEGNAIASGTRVDLWFVNNRWDIVNANCEPG